VVSYTVVWKCRLSNASLSSNEVVFFMSYANRITQTVPGYLNAKHTVLSFERHGIHELISVRR
jgi:hypothetical protein